MATQSMITEAVERILSDLADPQTVNNARDEGWKRRLWEAMEENGLTTAWVSEDLGGANLPLSAGFEIIRAAGGFALSVPLAETLLAGWLLALGGIAVPSGPMTVAPARPSDHIDWDASAGRLTGRSAAVPFAREAAHMAVVAQSGSETFVALVSREDCAIEPGDSLAAEPRDTVIFKDSPARAVVLAPAGFDRQALMLMGCVIRALQTAGALQSILSRTITYADERIAFGKPIAKFQAVQGIVAQLAGEVAAATAAATSAADSISQIEQGWDDGLFLEATAAKIRAAEAASLGSTIAHQVHGAIGLTTEHVLQRFTLRTLAWADDFGSEDYWAVELGNRVARLGGSAVWPLIAAR